MLQRTLEWPQILPDLLRAQIPRLVYTDLYTCVYVGVQTEELLKNEDSIKNSIIKVPWRLLWVLKLHIFTDSGLYALSLLKKKVQPYVYTGIITKPGGAHRGLEMDYCGWKWEKQLWAKALGVPGLCTASHRRGQNLVRAQTTQPLCGRHLSSHLGFAQTGCSVINPSGRVSPGGTTHSAATEQGFRGIWVGRALSDTASLWLTSGTKEFWPSFVKTAPF